MNPVCGAGHQVRGRKVEDPGKVGTVKHLRLQPYIGMSHHLCNLACYVTIVVQGPVGQAILMVVQGCPVVFVDQLDDGYQMV